MNETRLLTFLVIGTLVIGVTGITLSTLIPPLFEGDLAVSSYAGTLYGNGTFTEQFTYDVKTSGIHPVLSRSWEEPVLVTPRAMPSVVLVSAIAPPGTVAYARDDEGAVTVYGGSRADTYRAAISDTAQKDEVGIYTPGSFAAGRYTVTYTYVLNPLIEYDTEVTHLNLRLAGPSHVPYHAVRITVPADDIRQVHAYPPTLSTSHSGSTYTISGSAAADETIAIEMLGGPRAFSGITGFRTQVADLAEKTEAGTWYDLISTLSSLLRYLAMASVILVPVIFLAIYRVFGRERKVTVPACLSTVPDPSLRPWKVNLLFRKDAMVFDESGFYATLLDLHRRKGIRITPVEGTTKEFGIRVPGTASDDPYEQRVLGVLDQIAEDGLIAPGRLAMLARSAATDAAAMETTLRFQRLLAGVTTRADSTLVHEYIVDGRDHIVPLFLTSIIVFALSFMLIFLEPLQSPILIPAAALWGVLVIQALAALAMPSSLFGRWKDDHYREKLEWEAFRRFLSDPAMIRTSAPEDLSIWGEWLVYGTALGVGDKVEQAMAALGVNVADTGLPVGAVEIRAAFMPVLVFAPPARGRSGGGAVGR